MRIAITGGTGFVGRHLAAEFVHAGHEVVLVARGVDRPDPALLERPGVRVVTASVTDVAAMRRAFSGCDAIAHCAGINRELGRQTYAVVHVQGTGNVVAAARDAGVRRIVMLSFLRARPICGSAYLESKWAAEELIRNSGLNFSIVKASMVFGLGDHMLDHLSHLLYTLPVFVTVGLREKPVRPVAVQDLVRVLVAGLVDDRLANRTVSAMGPQTLLMSDIARKVGHLIGRRPLIVRAPAAVNYGVAWIAERLMKVPLASLAQVRILQEGLVEPWGDIDPLPDDLVPRTTLADNVLRAGLPEAGPFTRAHLRVLGSS